MGAGMPRERIVRSRRVVTPAGERPAAIHLKDGVITAVTDFEATQDVASKSSSSSSSSSVVAGVEVLDAGDLVVLPGLVDTHVHINDPGRSDWEGFATATRAAAAGGVTTVVDMPLNSVPPTTTLAGLREKLRALEDRALVDVALCGGLVPASAGTGALAELFAEGVLAFKCFLAESGVAEFSHVHESELRAGMKELARLGAPLFVHAELPEPLSDGEKAAMGLDPRRYATYLASRPRRAEDAAVELVVRLAKETGARAHVVHLSSSDALDTVRRAKDARVPLTVETCPHYLTFAAEEIPDGATAFKCAPPIREKGNREKLWDALREAHIDQVVTDHSPSTVELKCSGSGDFMKAWGGISSLQIGLAAVWTEARARGRTVRDLAEWMSAAPARLAGLASKKGAIATGFDADLVLWDPDARFTVDPATLEHKNKICAYEGRELRGVVARTILRGETIYERGAGFAPARTGRWIRRPSA
jgi:allantoinase